MDFHHFLFRIDCYGIDAGSRRELKGELLRGDISFECCYFLRRIYFRFDADRVETSAAGKKEDEKRKCDGIV